MHALALHRDKGIWGENADQFNPDNFSREAERERPVNAFKPFGNGQRACIGRQFALQEAVLTLGMSNDKMAVASTVSPSDISTQ